MKVVTKVMLDVTPAGWPQGQVIFVVNVDMFAYWLSRIIVVFRRGTSSWTDHAQSFHQSMRYQFSHR